MIAWTAGCWCIKRRIESIEVFRIQFFLKMAERLAEALEVDDFSGAEKADWIGDFRIFDNTENVVIGRAGFLLGSKAVSYTHLLWLMGVPGGFCRPLPG